MQDYKENKNNWKKYFVNGYHKLSVGDLYESPPLYSLQGCSIIILKKDRYQTQFSCILKNFYQITFRKNEFNRHSILFQKWKKRGRAESTIIKGRKKAFRYFNRAAREKNIKKLKMDFTNTYYTEWKFYKNHT